jgi:hypothetical protein
MVEHAGGAYAPYGSFMSDPAGEPAGSEAAHALSASSAGWGSTPAYKRANFRVGPAALAQ